MRLKRVEIIKFRNFENIVIDFEKNSTFPDVFSIASKNGGGKSTLLQFIFIMLHCFMDDDRKEYIQNILNNFSDITEEIKLVKFIVEENNIDYSLEFSILSTQNQYGDFNLYLDIKDTSMRIEKYKRDMDRNRRILMLKHELENSNRITPVLERDIKIIERFINSRAENELYRDARRTNDINIYKMLIDSIVKRNSISDDSINELEIIYKEIENKLNSLELILKTKKLLYITHLHNNQNIVILETNMDRRILKKLTNRIFLTAPSSQIFLFLSNGDKQDIFSNFIDKEYSDYEDNLADTKDDLKNFFTYDFASTEIILNSFKKAFDEDLRIKRRTKKYGTKYDELTEELKGFLDGKEITEDEDGERVIFKLKSTEKELSPEDLSHGELRKLGIYIWLKYLVEKDSIVLMDEPDIALHPKWQYELVKDLTKWSNSQFLLATHSPQIIGSTYYKNIIKLNNGEVKRLKEPPLDRDINIILNTIMEANYFPEALKELHNKYRELFENGEIDTPKAEELKLKILEYESENSSFFQSIAFDRELMDI